MFRGTLECFDWVTQEGALHGLMHSLHNQMDRLPTLRGSDGVAAFVAREAPAASKLSEFAVLKKRVQGDKVCVACGASPEALQICGQCKRQGVTYCNR